MLNQLFPEKEVGKEAHITGINKIAYRNIRAQMAKERITIQEAARRMGVPVDTISRKLCGFASFKLEEAILFRRVCFPDYSLEFLFEELFKEKE